MSGRIWCISNNTIDKLDMYSPNNNTNNEQIILIAKFDYKSKDKQELDLKKGEKLLLLDSSKQWWLVQRLNDSSSSSNIQLQTGYVPSNYVKKEKKSLIDKLISRKSNNSSSSSKNLLNTKSPPPISTTQQQQQQQQLLIKESLSNEFILNDNNNIKQSNHNSSSLSSSNYSNSNSNSFIINSNSNNQLNQSSTTTTTTNNKIAIVKHKYQAKKSDELTLEPQTQVNIINKYEDGWWKIEFNGQIGLYPSNYLDESLVLLTDLSNLNYNKKKSTTSNSSSNNNANNNNNSVHSSDNSIEKLNDLLTNNVQINSNNNNGMTIIDSISSNEQKEIEYVQCIYSYKSLNSLELTINLNEILKIIDDEDIYLNNDFNTSWIKVMNCKGTQGLIPSACVQPYLINNNTSFIFIRKPAEFGLFSNKLWYYGNISRYETNLMLNKFGINGDFIVRDSERDSGNYSISLKSENINNKHFKIIFKDNNFIIGKKMFTTMDELIEHYKMNPIFDQNNEKLFLIKPFESPQNK